MGAVRIITILCSLSIFVAARAVGETSYLDCLGGIREMVKHRVATGPAVAPGLARQATKLLGRELTPAQITSLERVNKFGVTEAYTPREIGSQNTLLAKAGYSKGEIATLRKNGLLSNWRFTSDLLPREIGVQDRFLIEINKDVIRSVQKGDEFYSYVEDSKGHLYLVRGNVEFSPDRVWIVRNSGQNGKGQSAIVVQEAGSFRFDAKAGEFRLKPTYGMDASDSEIARMIRFTKKDKLDLNIKYEHNPNLQKSRVLDCLDILSSGQQGKSFLLDQLIASNLVTASAIVSGELMGAGRLQSDKGRSVILADLAGGNINSVIYSAVASKLVLDQAKFGASMAFRGASGLGMIEIQKGVYAYVLGEDEKQLTDKLTNFNRLYFVAKLPVNHLVDNYIVKKLPVAVFDACKRGDAVRLFVSPRMIRIYERYASAIIYFGARQAIINE